MADTFHRGELAVQERAGVRDFADKVGRGIRRAVLPVVAEFLVKQPLVGLTTVGSLGDVWVSALTGAPSFVFAADEHTVCIRSAPIPEDPLYQNLHARSQIGLICVEFSSGRRLRMNGEGEFDNRDVLTLHVAQVYSNCRKYIQVRAFEGVNLPASPRRARRSAELDPDQQRLIQAADTLFIGSFYGAGGADASHRGGAAGFVQVLSPTELLIPDYRGNCMFQTLGNISINPGTGLLFLDFDSGRTLQLSGEASIVWGGEYVQRCPGAERALMYRIHSLIDTVGANRLQWRFVEPSPFNPS